MRRDLAAWTFVAPALLVVCICPHGSAAVVQRDHRAACPPPASPCTGHSHDEPAEPHDGPGAPGAPGDDSCQDLSLAMDQVRSSTLDQAPCLVHAWLAFESPLGAAAQPGFAALSAIDTGPPAPPGHLPSSIVLLV